MLAIGSDEGTKKILWCSFVHPKHWATAMLRSFASHDVSRGKKYIALASHGHSSFSHGRQSRERGGNLSPYDDIKGRFQIGPSELSFSQRRSRIPRARFTPIAISSHWGTIGRLVELILMLKNLIKWNFHAMGPLTEQGSGAFATWVFFLLQNRRSNYAYLLQVLHLPFAPFC